MIYFIQSGVEGPIKIGFAMTRSDCDRRLRILQIGNPEHLFLRGVLGGDMKRERTLHQRFHDGRIRGEWFRPDTPGLDDLISDALDEEALIESGLHYCEQCGINIVHPPRRKLCGPECERQKKIVTVRAWKRTSSNVPVVSSDDERLEKALLQVIGDD